MKGHQSIDVIIPLYNCEKYIRVAIESVLNQTFKANRIIVVDDGSIDGSAGIVKEIINAYPQENLEYFFKPNGGLSSARNFGIKQASSDFVAFLDADDSWMEDKLEKQMNVFRKNNNEDLGLVYCAYEIIDEKGNKSDDHYVLLIDHKVRGKVFDFLLHSNLIASSGSGVVVRKKCFDEVGGFDESLSAAEDWDMWLRIAERYEFDFVDEVLVKIRRHGSNMQGDIHHMLNNLLSFFIKWMQRKNIPKPILLQWGHIIAEFILRSQDVNKSKMLVKKKLLRVHLQKLYFRTAGSLEIYLFLKRIRKMIQKV